MTVTMREVAQLAGTSAASVSAVLNGNHQHNIRVSAATRQRILAAAKQLQFTPNQLAQSLAKRRTGVLGLVFPYSGAFVDRNPFSTQVMSGVFEEVVQDKYNLMLHTAVGNDWNMAEEGALLDSRVDGLILVIPSPHSPTVMRCLRESFPYITLVYAPTSAEVYAVNPDDFGGGRLATDHLLGLGHRRIAHLIGQPGIASTEPRKQGYLAALETAGLPIVPELLIPAGFDWHEGYAAMQNLLNLPPSRRPTAVFAANDLCAEGALRALRERGLRVPEDMAVVGFDDTWFATMTQPPLTSIRMPIAEMGALATQMLIALVEGRPVENRQPVLPVSLTIRESCGASQSRRDL